MTSSWNGYGGSGFSGNASESFSFLNRGMGGPSFEFAGRFRRRRRQWDVGRRRWRRLFGRWRQLRHAVGGGGGSFNSGTDQLSGANAGTRRVSSLSFRHYGLAPQQQPRCLVSSRREWLDQSATANHATVYGATPTADRHGVAGKALLFEGSSSNEHLKLLMTLSSSPSAIPVGLTTSTTNNHGSPITFRGNGRGFNLYKVPDNTWSYWTGNGGWRSSILSL